jgi:hypothetical protein
MKVLLVITSHDQRGSLGRKTGFWLEELAASYYVFKDAGVEITLASPKGGRPLLDPKSNEPEFRTDLTHRFEKDTVAESQLDKTVRLDSVRQEDFDTVFYPGGHGPMWDLAEDKHSIKLIEPLVAAGILVRITRMCCRYSRQHHSQASHERSIDLLDRAVGTESLTIAPTAYPCPPLEIGQQSRARKDFRCHTWSTLSRRVISKRTCAYAW